MAGGYIVAMVLGYLGTSTEANRSINPYYKRNHISKNSLVNSKSKEMESKWQPKLWKKHKMVIFFALNPDNEKNREYVIAFVRFISGLNPILCDHQRYALKVYVDSDELIDEKIIVEHLNGANLPVISSYVYE